MSLRPENVVTGLFQLNNTPLRPATLTKAFGGRSSTWRSSLDNLVISGQAYKIGRSYIPANSLPDTFTTSDFVKTSGLCKTQAKELLRDLYLSGRVSRTNEQFGNHPNLTRATYTLTSRNAN